MGRSDHLICHFISCPVFPAKLSSFLSRNTNKTQLVIEFIIPKLLKAQHVLTGTPLIIRSPKLYLQPLVYIPMWWPAVVKA